MAARYADEAGAPTVLAMLDKKLNCPRTSSAGRLFDAASGLLGLCLKMEMDAEAAIRLEQAATRRIEGLFNNVDTTVVDAVTMLQSSALAAVGR